MRHLSVGEIADRLVSLRAGGRAPDPLVSLLVDGILAIARLEATRLPVQLLTDTATLPTRSHDVDAGLDLYADLPDQASFHLLPGQNALIKTGIAVAVPPGHYLRIAPRSGLGLKMVDVFGGVVDQGYRGDVSVNLVNIGMGALKIEQGMRIAQAVLERISIARPVKVDVLPPSERGTAGFGSTGA